MKDLLDYIKEANEQIQDPIEGGLDIALSGEIFLYSDRNGIFSKRKKKIAETFKNKLPLEKINADYISKTPIFKLYIRDLKEGYRKDIDENMQINISTEDDLRRQIADSMVLIIKNVDF